MTNSILQSTKKVLGLDEEYTVFDTDVIMHINTTFSKLLQLGVGPQDGFEIESEAESWDQFTDDDKMLNMVKSYVYLSVRLLFDPPTTSYLIAAYQKQMEEMEYRLNVHREEEYWTPPQTLTT